MDSRRIKSTSTEKEKRRKSSSISVLNRFVLETESSELVEQRAWNSVNDEGTGPSLHVVYRIE